MEDAGKGYNFLSKGVYTYACMHICECVCVNVWVCLLTACVLSGAFSSFRTPERSLLFSLKGMCILLDLSMGEFMLHEQANVCDYMEMNLLVYQCDIESDMELSTFIKIICNSWYLHIHILK